VNETIHLLFSYGTLQLEKVQQENYGRLLIGEADRLTSYKIEKIQITDSDVLAKSQLEYHPIAIKSEDDGDFTKECFLKLQTRNLSKPTNTR
jgi:hypothetical protein